MAQGDVLVFPDSAAGHSTSGIDTGLLALLNQNGGFGGNGSWFWMILLWMMWQRNGAQGDFSAYASQFGAEGRQYLAEIMNGRFDNLGNLANILNTSVSTIQNMLFTIQSNIQQVGAQVGMSALQTQNAIALGNASLAQQLCQCCCENRLAIATQTNEIDSRIAAMDADVRLQIAKMEGNDALAVCQQTNQLGSQADRNTTSILSAIKDQNAMIVDQFCQLKERELQNKIDTQGDIITQLRGQISNDKQTEAFNVAINALNEKINQIAAKQPNTVPVQYPNLVAVNQTPYAGGYNYGWGNGIVF